MTRLFPFACASSLGTADSTMIAPPIRCPNVRRQDPVVQHTANPTHFTLDKAHRRDEMAGVIAKSIRADTDRRRRNIAVSSGLMKDHGSWAVAWLSGQQHLVPARRS